MAWLNSTWTYSFFGVALAQCLICLALEAYVFGQFQYSLNSNARGNSKPSAALTIPTYLALFIFGFIYELALVWDALRARNTIQVIGICMYNAGMLIYASVEVSQVNEAITQLLQNNDLRSDERAIWLQLRPFLIAGPCVMALGTILLSLIAWKLYDEFAWTIYKNISADLRLKRRYLTFQIYIALLKFDFFFFLGFTVQFLVVVPDTSDFEFYITIAAVPVTILFLFLAAYFTSRESHVGQSLTLVVYFAGAAYFIFKLVRMYDSNRAEDYRPARNGLTTFAILTLLCLVATIVVAVMCMRNFNKGLKPHIKFRWWCMGRSSPKEDQLEYGGYASGQGFDGQPPHALGQVSSRMTID